MLRRFLVATSLLYVMCCFASSGAQDSIPSALDSIPSALDSIPSAQGSIPTTMQITPQVLVLYHVAADLNLRQRQVVGLLSNLMKGLRQRYGATRFGLAEFGTKSCYHRMSSMVSNQTQFDEILINAQEHCMFRHYPDSPIVGVLFGAVDKEMKWLSSLKFPSYNPKFIILVTDDPPRLPDPGKRDPSLPPVCERKVLDPTSTGDILANQAQTYLIVLSLKTHSAEWQKEFQSGNYNGHLEELQLRQPRKTLDNLMRVMVIAIQTHKTRLNRLYETMTQPAGEIDTSDDDAR